MHKAAWCSGSQGERGLTGATGPASTVPGPQGERGLTGATGPASTVPGPQGAMGFNGTDGEDGATGPAGITFMNNTNTYTRVASSINSPFTTPPFYTQALATCDPGDFAISGGLIGPFPSTTAATAYDAIPIQLFKNPDSWAVILKSPTNFQEFSAQVTCFNNP